MKRIIYYSILIFIFSCIIGFFYSRIWKSNNEELANENVINKSNVITETVSTEEKVSFNSNFAIKKYYDKCGHVEVNVAELPYELINLTKNEIETIYSNWNVEEFSSNNLVLSRNEDTICNDHYVLKMNSDAIDVYHLEQNGEESLYKSTDIIKDYLTENDIKNLEEGIYVYGKSNINSVIEDFE